jgi:hypothetical protein
MRGTRKVSIALAIGKKPCPFFWEESDKLFMWSCGGWLSSGELSDLAPNLECGWQGVFCKHHQLEWNWKKGNCAIKTLVLCC